VIEPPKLAPSLILEEASGSLTLLLSGLLAEPEMEIADIDGDSRSLAKDKNRVAPMNGMDEQEG
jgi:hypothetical protein